MDIQLIGSQAVKILSMLTGQDLTLKDITPQVIFIADLIALLKGVVHADTKVSEDEITQFRSTLNKLNLNNKQTIEVAKLLLSGIQKYQLYKKINDFVILLVPLSESEKLLLFGLGYQMAMADSSLDETESIYLRNLGRLIHLDNRFFDVFESSFSGKSYNSDDFQKLYELVDPARFHKLGTVFVNAADNLQNSLNIIADKNKDLGKPISLTVVEALPIKLDDEYQKLQGFQLQKQSLLKRINRLHELIDGGIKESLLPITFRDDIQSIKAKLESQRFRVAVIGDFSQGKSTLLNALLGEEIQPVRAIPCSGTLSVLKYGDSKRVVCRYRDGSEQEIAVEDYQKKTAISKEAALNNRSEELLKSNIAEIVFEHPNLSLCRNGVEIVDSPGLNEHPDRTRVTEELLKNTDAILFMTNANKLLTQGERDIITRIKEREGDRPLENLFLVVNFMDNLDSDEDREDVQIAANSIIKDGSITGKERIHFISARSALKAIINKASDKYLVDFKNLTQILEVFLTDERGSVILQSTAQRLNELTQSCIDELNKTVNYLNVSLTASYREEILEQIGEASGRFINICEIVSSWEVVTIQAVLDDWGQFYVEIKDAITQSNTEWQTEHNPYWSRDELIQDYINCFRYSLEGFIEQWLRQGLLELITAGIDGLDEEIRTELDALNISFSKLDRKIGTNFSDDLQPVLNKSYIHTVASQSGGVGGSLLTAGALAASAVFFSPGLIMIAIGSFFGGGILGLSISDIYYKIADKVCEEGFNEFEKSEDSFKEKIEDYINSSFMERTAAVDQLIKQIISECENRLELEERKHQESVDIQRLSISAKKREFEQSLSS
jgi:uncharacterized tellurite resistance protein B-like protein